MTIPPFRPAHKLSDSEDDIPDLESFTSDEKENEEIEFFNCFNCKKKSKYDYNCYFIEETGEFITALCGDCKESLLKPCTICDKDFDRDEVRYLLYNFGKLEKCITCKVTSNDYVLKSNDVDILKIEENIPLKDDFKIKYEELLINVNKILEISNSQNIDEAINTFSTLKEDNNDFIKIIENNEELTCPEDIPIIINEKNKYKNKYNHIKKKIKENDILEEDKFLDFLEKYKIRSRNTSVPDYFMMYLFSEDEEEKRKRLEKEKKEKQDILRKKINKNILKSRLINIFNELYNNKDKIKNEREEKIHKIKNKFNLNIIKSKTINILRNFNEQHNVAINILRKIESNKNKIKFENKNIQQYSVTHNRTKITFFAKLYEEHEINKKLSKKDLLLAAEEYHKDKNTTRMLHLCKIMYYLSNNDKIYKSDIIFKHLYTFQSIKDYQIDYLISKIEEMV